MNQRLHVSGTFEDSVRRILIDVVALHGAEFGNVQMPVGDRLVIVDQLGLDAAFLSTFREVRSDDGCACGRALREGRAVVVADVEADEAYAPFRTAAKRAGYRSVQSTPMVTSGGTVVGLVSTLFANAYAPTQIEMATLSRYCRLAADRLLLLLDGQKLSTKALELHNTLYSRAGISPVS